MASTWSIIARNEYLEGVRSRWFLVMTLFVPLIFGGMIALTTGLTLHAGNERVHMALVDHSQPPIGDIVRTALEKSRGGTTQFVVEMVANEIETMSALETRVASGDLDGYLVLPDNVAHGGRSLYRGTNASSLALVPRLTGALRSAVIAGRAKALGLKADDVGVLLADVALDTEQANGVGKASGGASIAVAYVAALVLYGTILLYGVTVARSVIQEKTSRVIELLLACARPWDLMVGKILGVGALGLTQLSVWLGGARILVSLRGPLLARMGVKGLDALELPHLGALEVAIVLVYFLGGYFLYASLFAAVGAACSSERDMQQAQLPLLLPLVAAVMCFPVITSNPRGALSVGMTLVPFFSPVLMPMRYLLTPVPAWQLATSMGLLLATTVATTWFASRIYRVGILMVGKKASLGEVARWIRGG